MVKRGFIGLLAVLQTAFAGAQTVISPTPAIPFTLADQNGVQVSLTNYRGKTVLLLFWASWCAPCRIENRKLAKRYRRFKDLPFEIISVSVDTELNKWRKAIQRDHMTWPQLIDTADISKSVARQWGVAVLPASFLVNPAGAVTVADAALLPVNDPEGFRTLIKKWAGTE